MIYRTFFRMDKFEKVLEKGGKVGYNGYKWQKVERSGAKWHRKWQTTLKEGDPMLTGEFNHSIDSKGRLIIPSKLRESLGEHFVITKGMDGCLFLYPDNEWKAFEEKLRTLPLTNKKARAIMFLNALIGAVSTLVGSIM